MELGAVLHCVGRQLWLWLRTLQKFSFSPQAPLLDFLPRPRAGRWFPRSMVDNRKNCWKYGHKWWRMGLWRKTNTTSWKGYSAGIVLNLKCSSLLYRKKIIFVILIYFSSSASVKISTQLHSELKMGKNEKKCNPVIREYVLRSTANS